MATFQHKFAWAAVISFCGLGTIEASPAVSASLMLGFQENLQNYYIVSKQDRTNNIALSSQESRNEKSLIANSLGTLSTAEAINQNIKSRYQSLIEEDTEQIGLIESHQLLQSEGLVKQATATTVNSSSGEPAFLTFPQPIILGLLLLLSLRLLHIFYPLFGSAGKIFKEETVENFRDKYGKPKLSESTAFLHDRAFKLLEDLARQAQQIDSEKFGIEEFLLFYKIKKSIKQGIEEYKKLDYSGELLKIAIAAQNSFLKIEQTELRFRSYKQQEFYLFIEDYLTQDIDKKCFRNLVESKLTEIIPLLNTEEGKQALQEYLKEIKIISKHELGLKLLSLFKKYQLADYATLRKVSDITSRLEGRDLLASKNLVVLVIENYETFEKIGPIIGIAEAESSPDVYAKLLQYIGLNYRYQNSFAQFERLLKILKEWEKPYQTIVALRQEYNSSNYRLSKEFFQPIPGLNVYKKYEQYIN